MQHIAPQLGTLLYYYGHCRSHRHHQTAPTTTTTTSKQSVVNEASILIDGNIDSKYDFSFQRTKLFALELFDSEWSRLGSMTGPHKELFESSYTRFKDDFRTHHRSSMDIFNTSRAGKSLMGSQGMSRRGARSWKVRLSSVSHGDGRAVCINGLRGITCERFAGSMCWIFCVWATPCRRNAAPSMMKWTRWSFTCKVSKGCLFSNFVF